MMTDSGKGRWKALSSQASSAGRDEDLVRRRIVETGDVDAMIAVRGNFFYRNDVLGKTVGQMVGAARSSEL